ncbi:hypothetical protein HRI_000321500 [Hibiscus trionum]|uniref:Uncharacterized protein n=1 Tax=Hibiscus trionum TaxID=183268 RepID=A0A9W7GWV9_HIBTR|nr:hypothetical protein HRI_000321500 [Hibiscus trionum]
MGRRPLVLKRQTKHPMLEAKDPTGGVEKQPESSVPSSEIAKMQTNSADMSSLAKANKHAALSMVRRSQRIQNAVSPSQVEEFERIIEEITLSEGEKDDAPLDGERKELPEPIQTQKSLEEKVNYLLRQSEEQRKTIEELNFKATRDSSPTGSPQGADVRYRKLYFESQKKIESLMNENHQLALKLERALGKLEAYDNGACAISEGFKKMKEMILVTNLTRSTETAVNFSTQAFPSMDAGAEPKSSPKKKKARAGK